MKERAFRQVDVFTPVPYRGNPLAVVLDGGGLSVQEMQRFTDWTNLSEAAFVLPPTRADADYRVRIFCPGRELPFAGHPTLGTCHAWLEAGGRPRGERIVQECGVGLVDIRREGDRLAFAAPPLRRGGPLPEQDVDLIARGLGLARDEIVAHAWCDNGPAWRGVMLRSAGRVLAVEPDAELLSGLEIGIVGPHEAAGTAQGRDAAEACAFEVRAFFPGNGGVLLEDPVTGSLNAALGQWLIGAGLAPRRYVAAQGSVLGRQGRVHVACDAQGAVWVGGASVTCLQGTARL